LELMQARTLVRSDRTAPVVADHEREHVLERHENEAVVAFRVARVVTGMGVDLSDDPEFERSSDPGCSAHSRLTGMDTLRPVAALGDHRAHDERVQVDCPAAPKDETLVTLVTPAKTLQGCAR
jgi:hypothetical protein